MAGRLATAARAIGRFTTSGEVDQVPAYRVGDPAAGMSFELDYCANPLRGARPEWSNNMAALSWWYWLTYDGLSAAGRVSVPSLLVHSDGCVFPENLRSVYASLQGPKQLEWLTGTQTDFYEQAAQVERAVSVTDAFLKGQTA